MSFQLKSVKPKGLENVGATCYMNAVLQCFYHVKPLTAELINYNFLPYNIKQMPMTFAFLDVIRQLTLDKSNAGRPIMFKNAISVNPLFTGIQANDSKDLILYFLEKIDNELTMVVKYYSQNYNYLNNITSLQVFKKEPELQNIFNIFIQNHKSIFSNLFYGFMNQSIKCTKCHQIVKNYQIFNFIIFPIENVYNSKKGNNNKNSNYKNPYDDKRSPASMPPAGMPSGGRNSYFTNNGTYGNFYRNNPYNSRSNTNSYGYNSNNYSGKKSVTLIDCFKNEMEVIDFVGDNQIYCNNCKKLSDAKGTNRIFTSPHVLILILNRGKANQFDCDVEFNEKLNIKEYVLEKNFSPTDYKLIGVISHFGESNMSGHFIADCLHFDNKWYTFNDGIVSGPYNNYTKKGTPYILFYQNVNDN